MIDAEKTEPLPNHPCERREKDRLNVYIPKMFKKFNANEDITGHQNVKSSVQRGIKSKIVEMFFKLKSLMKEIIFKKLQLLLIKIFFLLI